MTKILKLYPRPILTISFDNSNNNDDTVPSTLTQVRIYTPIGAIKMPEEKDSQASGSIYRDLSTENQVMEAADFGDRPSRFPEKVRRAPTC